MKYIYVQPLGGLCNRMRVIVGAFELAKILNRKIIVIWTRDKTLNCRFDNLFESIPCKVIETKLSSISQRIRWHYIKDIRKYTILDDSWILKEARGKDIDSWIYKIKDKKLFINANVDIILNGVYRIFNPQQSLLEKYNNVKCDKNVIGIHLRRTDNANAIKHSPTELFIKKVKREITQEPELKFYLATDDPKEEDTFIKEFGEKILIYKKHSLDRNNPSAIKDALIDLYNLSCCRKIYGSYYSSFSDTAALWSGIDKETLKY